MPSKTVGEHRFGGAWTEVKLKALADYMQFYTGALKNQGFETWYIDAFAGTGQRTEEVEMGGLFDGEPTYLGRRLLDGSARKALAVSPPFQHYVFIEEKARRVKALCKLLTEFPGHNIAPPIKGDANSAMSALLSSSPWVGDASRARRQRGLVFLDPYGMSVRWSTLKLLADSRKVDVWYLFPMWAVVRQLSGTSGGIDEHKRAALTEIFGTSDWEGDFYASQRQGSLFEDTRGNELAINIPAIEKYARGRLRTLFCFVSDPVPMLLRGHRFYLLMCLSNNPRAVPLIKKGVDFVVAKYTSASHRTSGL